MGSFLGGLGASFVSYAAIDAGSLLDEVDLLDDFDDDNLGRLVPDSKVNNTTSTDLNLKKNSPFSKSTYDSNISEPSPTEAYVDPTTDSGDSGKISNPSLEGEFDKNLDTNVLPSPEVVDMNDSLYSNNNLNGTLGQDVNSQENVGASNVNNGSDDNLNPPVELGKDVTDTGNLSDLYQKDSNSDKLDTPVAPISDVLKPTEPTKLPKHNNNNGKNKKNVNGQNNGLKLLGGLAAGMVGPLALIKYNKNLKSSGLVDKLGGLIDKVRNKWIPADTGTSDDNKNQELKEPQQTDEKKSKEEPTGSITPNALDTPAPDETTTVVPNENIGKNQCSNKNEEASAFSILFRILGVGTVVAVVLIYCLSTNNKSIAEKKEENGSTEGEEKYDPKTVAFLQKKIREFLKKRESVNNTSEKLKSEESTPKVKEEKIEAAKEAINNGVTKDNIKKIIEEKYIKEN